MAYKIIASQCTACSACEPVCPNAAISQKKGVFVINPPYTLHAELHTALPWLAQALAQYDGADHLLEQHAV